MNARDAAEETPFHWHLITAFAVGVRAVSLVISCPMLVAVSVVNPLVLVKP